MSDGKPLRNTYAYAGREEGLRAPALRKVPTGPVKSTPAQIEAALDRAYRNQEAIGGIRRCSRCGTKGHNMRSCPDNPRPLAITPDSDMN